MNTPAHLAASILVWRNESTWKAASAVAIGAVLPDLPMFGFYGYQRLVVGSSESEIWSKLYFREDWQLLFDIFNSSPLACLLIGVSYFFGFRWGVLLAGSALLHMCCDLPLHHDDAHRHFLPLTTWRFASPVSYWDPKHYGFVFIWVELALAVGSSVYVAWKGKHPPMRLLALGTLVLYFAGIAFAVAMWLPQLAIQD
jgi:hypothetical protein